MLDVIQIDIDELIFLNSVKFKIINQYSDIEYLFYYKKHLLRVFEQGDYLYFQFYIMDKKIENIINYTNIIVDIRYDMRIVKKEEWFFNLYKLLKTINPITVELTVNKEEKIFYKNIASLFFTCERQQKIKNILSKK